MLTAFAGPPASAAYSLPSLPAANGEIDVPAQEWPRQPGPRTIHVYVHYPGGALSNVTARTGLMLSLHNWGGTGARGAPDPVTLANSFNVVAINVDYVQSGKYNAELGPPYDHGYFQALDALRGLHFVWNELERAGVSFAKGRIFATGGSGGGNVSLMANKLAPRTFACIIDICGMPKLSDDVAFNLPGGSTLNAGYNPNPDAPRYLNADAQAIRFVGHPGHAATMKALGNTAKIVIVHGTTDVSCLPEDAREMADNLRAAGLDVEPHFITEADLDGEVLKSTGHSLGDRTKIVSKFAGQYLDPGSTETLVRTTPSDFEHRDDEVRYETPNGVYIISYNEGYPVGLFERR
jgi:predicted esterase